MNSTRPLIGIGLNYQRGDDKCYRQRHYYASAVEQAGGLPILLPFHTDLSIVRELVQRLDGLLLSGGDDLDPAAYGEPRHPKTDRSSRLRQQFDLAVLEAAERRQISILGICLGSQVMNVHRGGTLLQYLPELAREEAVDHRLDGVIWPEHSVRLEQGSMLAHALERDEMIVNSSHKQAVASVGQGLRVCAIAPDGVIEGIEDPSLPLYLGVQWHPERLYDRPEHLRLFEMLVERAATSHLTFEEDGLSVRPERCDVANMDSGLHVHR